MGRARRMRALVGVLKDKVSILKVTLLLSSKPTSFHVAVIRATTHHPTDPPPEYTLDTILSLTRQHQSTASAIVDTVLLRLHRTQDAFVSLKCLLTLHHILRRGSPDLISTPPWNESTHLNLTNFVDESDSDTLELSKWVRWYTQVIQQSLLVSDALGSNIYSHPLPHHMKKYMYNNPQIGSKSSTNLLNELNSLVKMIEQICRCPDSLDYQRMNLVYEVMKLVGEDYRITLREILSRVTQFREKFQMDDLSEEEVQKLLEVSKRLEECREKALLMFLNKKSSDGTWDSIAQLGRDVEGEKQRRESLRLIMFQGSELTQPSESRLVAPRGKKWLDVEWNKTHRRIRAP